MDKIRPAQDSSSRSPRKGAFNPKGFITAFKSKNDIQKLKIDQKVVVSMDDEHVEGFVRYIAEEPESDGTIPVGIELTEKKGRGTGMFKKKQLFVCKEGYALFVPARAVIPAVYGYHQQERLDSSEHAANQRELANQQQHETTQRELANERQQRETTQKELANERQQHETTRRELENQSQRCQNAQRQLQDVLRQLENERHLRQDAQSQLENEQQQHHATRIELENEQQHRQNRDWVLERDEIQVTDKVIGIGGWGSVKEGRFRGTTVAVKEIHEILNLSSDHYRRIFQREMQIAARCRHPCLLQFIGATNDNDAPLFVTELLETSLRAVLNETKRNVLETKQKNLISLDVARALNYLHLNRPTPIIHRDISSANVLLWRDGESWRAKVSDYGTANFMYRCKTIGPGAPPYSAPESRTPRQTTKIDVFSYGVLILEMNTREFPDPSTRAEQLRMVPHGPLRSLISRCLAASPDERPSMAQIIPIFEN